MIRVRVIMGRSITEAARVQGISNMQRWSFWRGVYNPIMAIGDTIAIAVRFAKTRIAGITMGRWSRDARSQHTSRWDKDIRK